jgi:hypothetical protein
LARMAEGRSIQGIQVAVNPAGGFTYEIH